MEIRYLESAVTLLKRNCVNREDLDLSKEVLWVSVGQRAAELPAINVGGLKKSFATRPGACKSGSNRAEWHSAPSSHVPF